MVRDLFVRQGTADALPSPTGALHSNGGENLVSPGSDILVAEPRPKLALENASYRAEHWFRKVGSDKLA